MSLPSPQGRALAKGIFMLAFRTDRSGQDSPVLEWSVSGAKGCGRGFDVELSGSGELAEHRNEPLPNGVMGLRACYLSNSDCWQQFWNSAAA